MRLAVRVILCISLALAFAGVASPAQAGCYPPPCAAPAAGSAVPAVPVAAVGQASADPVDSRSPALVVGFALLLVMGTLTTLCVSRYQQGVTAAVEIERRPAAQPKTLTRAERSVA